MAETPLIKKLGFKPTSTIRLVNAPKEYFKWLGTEEVNLVKSNEYPDFVHVFVMNIHSLDREMEKIRKKMKPATAVWVSWPKRASGINTDITEESIRNYALTNGLVDVKVCSVSEIWSGLKLVIPMKLRPQL